MPPFQGMLQTEVARGNSPIGLCVERVRTVSLLIKNVFGTLSTYKPMRNDHMQNPPAQYPPEVVFKGRVKGR